MIKRQRKDIVSISLDSMAVAQQTGDKLTTVLMIYGTWETSAMTRHFDEKPLFNNGV